MDSHEIVESGILEQGGERNARNEPWERPEGSRPWVVNGSTCAHPRRDGSDGKCRMPAGWGTDHIGYGHCKLHGGNTRNHRIASAKQELAATTSRFMGSPIDVDPASALLMCVQIAAGHVEYATRQLAAVPEREGIVDTPYGGQLHPWAKVQAEAIDRLAKYSRLAVECGAEERTVRLAEQWGGQLADLITQVLDQLELSDDQRALVPDAITNTFKPIEQSNQADALDIG